HLVVRGAAPAARSDEAALRRDVARQRLDAGLGEEPMARGRQWLASDEDGRAGDVDPRFVRRLNRANRRAGERPEDGVLRAAAGLGHPRGDAVRPIESRDGDRRRAKTRTTRRPCEEARDETILQRRWRVDEPALGKASALEAHEEVVHTGDARTERVPERERRVA